jgi:hypothetical protein
MSQIQIIPSEIERSCVDGGTALRGIATNLPYNKNLISRLQAIVDKEWTAGNNFFLD